MNKQDLYNILSHAPNTRIVNSTELCTRCFICGDSLKNPNKKRLYIHIDPSDPKEPVIYHCFNCFAKGIFTANMLLEMGISHNDASTFIKRLNYSATRDDGSRANRYRNIKEVKVDIPPPMGDAKTLRKIKYLYDRIGYRIPPEDFDTLKIIPNLWDFLRANNIPPNNKYVDLLDSDYIGFLSTHNEYVILRDITDSNQMRYVKYNIFGVVDNSHGFYTTRAMVDLITTEDIHIIISEGVFDVLSIMYNIHKGDRSNKVYIASVDGSFTAPLMAFIRKGLVGSNIFIDCYQDNDTRMNFKDIRQQFRPYTPHFNVYYNRLAKDFGVPSHMIDMDTLLI